MFGYLLPVTSIIRSVDLPKAFSPLALSTCQFTSAYNARLCSIIEWYRIKMDRSHRYGTVRPEARTISFWRQQLVRIEGVSRYSTHISTVGILQYLIKFSIVSDFCYFFCFIEDAFILVILARGFSPGTGRGMWRAGGAE